ncbi:hypothetical protein FRB94_012423 [Tulasnella sp. JGI-2019a]|nr:hypothetical protein FRB93_010448 [Tulasnella sp. JGI-2019a]KAG9009151.1 hypothetical protein FRB94_012423 [Tulasnella sp. JGI-2019a]KAG9038357.1 hypothetical protein FRB95_001769 [Tulasnella sp. JGI-2019a]
MESAQSAVGVITGSGKLMRDEAILEVRELIKENGDGGWDKAWQKNKTPWDAGKSQPAFTNFMESDLGKKIRGEHSKEPRALVPGSGKGYDAAYLASIGYDTWGVDLSERAIQLAEATQPANPKLAFRVLDFFKFEVPETGFDLIYDYTFFCAIPVDLRNGWGDRMRRLVRPEGYLITLVYPIDGPRTGGPPYSVSVELVSETLNGGSPGTASFEKIYDAVPEVTDESHRNRERLVVWRRTCT